MLRYRSPPLQLKSSTLLKSSVNQPFSRKIWDTPVSSHIEGVLKQTSFIIKVRICPWTTSSLDRLVIRCKRLISFTHFFPGASQFLLRKVSIVKPRYKLYQSLLPGEGVNTAKREWASLPTVLWRYGEPGTFKAHLQHCLLQRDASWWWNETA